MRSHCYFPRWVAALVGVLLVMVIGGAMARAGDFHPFALNATAKAEVPAADILCPESQTVSGAPGQWIDGQPCLDDDDETSDDGDVCEGGQTISGVQGPWVGGQGNQKDDGQRCQHDDGTFGQHGDG